MRDRTAAIAAGELKAFLRAPLPPPGVVAAGFAPRLSILIPSYNQARFLERTLLSILKQGYPGVQILVADGGSTDGTVEILRGYSEHIAWWVSERDGGQAQALNKALERATGDLVGWQNSDDVYLPGAFREVAEAWRRNPDAAVYYSNVLLIDEEDDVLDEVRYVPFTRQRLLWEGPNLTNQSAFFAATWLRRMRFDERLRYAMDGDLYLRLADAGARFEFFRRYWGCLRMHADAKGQTIADTVGRSEWLQLRARYGIRMAPDRPWRQQQRLRKLGLQAQRVAQLLRQGDADYVWRGLLRRAGVGP